jgi:hypothetical protein
MKSQPLPYLLIALNLIVLVFISARPNPNETFDKITVKEFELVGAGGERRANIKVETDGTVVFRMMDKTGTIRVKLAANEDGSGLVLLDDSTEPAIHALAEKDGGRITVQDKNGNRTLD